MSFFKRPENVQLKILFLQQGEYSLCDFDSLEHLRELRLFHNSIRRSYFSCMSFTPCPSVRKLLIPDMVGKVVYVVEKQLALFCFSIFRLTRSTQLKGRPVNGKQLRRTFLFWRVWRLPRAPLHGLILKLSSICSLTVMSGL